MTAFRSAGGVSSSAVHSVVCGVQSCGLLSRISASRVPEAAGDVLYRLSRLSGRLWRCEMWPRVAPAVSCDRAASVSPPLGC